MLCLLLILLTPLAFAQSPGAYQYFLSGDSRDVHPRTSPGYLLAGGGNTDDDAFRWFLSRSGGGDVVVLRASGTDAYNPYFHKLAKLDSVETIVFREAAAARNRFVLERIRNADALFLAGGDQWNYVRFWKDTPVAAVINGLIRRGVPIGGTSAGLAVLGEFGFSAEHDTVTSAQALADPFDRKVNIVTGFLKLPGLGCLITDSHFSQRDRMGRLLVFLARIRDENRCRQVRAIAVDERAAVRLDHAGHAVVSGDASAFFLKLRQPAKLKAGAPAQIPAVSVVAVPAGGTFDVKRWAGPQPQTVYQLTTAAGQIRSSLTGRGRYGEPK